MNTLKKLKEGRTQKELATLLKVSQPTVCDWLNGKAKPRIPHIRRISEVSGVPFETVVVEIFQ